MPARGIFDFSSDRDAVSSTFLGVCAAYVLTATLSISFSTPGAALETVPGSPCAEICSSNNLSHANDTVCFDADYQSGNGQQFRECTTCLLNSTAVDTASNVSDVYWGLLNLRYTLSECMFAYPAEIVSISSPCQVTCQPLANATTYDIGEDVQTATENTIPNLDYCDNGFGGANRINNCSFCYSFIPQQLFLANFLQALHIACRQPPAIGDTFYPDGLAIFNESAIPGPLPPGTGSTDSGGLSGWQLGLVIALPVVGGAALLALTCFCCFKFTKKRRVKMAAAGRMSRYHDQHPSVYSSPETATRELSQHHWPAGQDEPPREMERIQVVHQPKNGKIPSPGLYQGRWSHYDRDDDEPPLSAVSAVSRDDVGPAPGQVKDPNLHEQYFGIASSGSDDAPGPSTQHLCPDERGQFVS